jgi:hypothetical protein
MQFTRWVGRQKTRLARSSFVLFVPFVVQLHFPDQIRLPRSYRVADAAAARFRAARATENKRLFLDRKALIN